MQQGLFCGFLWEEASSAVRLAWRSWYEPEFRTRSSQNWLRRSDTLFLPVRRRSKRNAWLVPEGVRPKGLDKKLRRHLPNATPWSNQFDGGANASADGWYRPRERIWFVRFSIPATNIQISALQEERTRLDVGFGLSDAYLAQYSRADSKPWLRNQ